MSIKLKLENLNKRSKIKLNLPKHSTPTEQPEIKPPQQHGGARPDAGRPPSADKAAIKEVKRMIREHALEEIEIEIKTKDSQGKEIVVKKKLPRALAMLNALFALGMKGNTKAISLYYDRTTGKMAIPIKNDDDDESETSNVFRFVTTTTPVLK